MVVMKNVPASAGASMEPVCVDGRRVPRDRTNPDISKMGPYRVDGVPYRAYGTTYHWSGHYMDAVDIDGVRHEFEWYDLIRDDTGGIVGRCSAFTSDRRIQSLISRVLRPALETPTGFTWAARISLGKNKPGSSETGTDWSVTVPEDIIAASGLLVDDEIRIELWSIGPHPEFRGRRLHHLVFSGGRPALRLRPSSVSPYNKSWMYDGEKSDIKTRPLEPGEVVGIVVSYDLRTGLRELADVPKSTRDPYATLVDLSGSGGWMEEHIRQWVCDRNATIRKQRKEDILGTTGERRDLTPEDYGFINQRKSPAPFVNPRWMEEYKRGLLPETITGRRYPLSGLSSGSVLSV